MIGALILLVGLGASVVLAAGWRSSVLNSNRKSFKSTARTVRTTLNSSLDASLSQTRTLSAIATMEPTASESRFLQWYQQLKRRGAAPAGVASALIQIVPASRLAGFRRDTEADPVSRALQGGAFKIVPPGARSVYCLTKASVGQTAATNLYPPLLDYCAPVIPGFGRSPFAALIRTATRSGSTIVIRVPGTPLVAVGEAVYRRGVSLLTGAARRAAVTGIVGTSFVGAGLVRPALAGRRSLTAALYHRNIGGQLQLVGRAGSLAGGRGQLYSERNSLGEGWTVAIKGTAPGAKRAGVGASRSCVSAD